MLKPKIITTLRNYSLPQFYADLSAGLIVGIIALPLAIAFGIASGVSPEQGIITGIIGGFFVSALGGSRVQIGGPTGAFIVIVYGVVQQYGINGLMTATLMAGIILVIMGFAKLGKVIKFIPQPVIIGFTSGIAVIIFSSQMKDFLGLGIESLPSDFIPKWQMIFTSLHSVSYPAFAVGALSLLSLIILPRYTGKIPASIVVVIVMTFIVRYFSIPVETIGSRFGEINASIPMPSMPTLDFQMIKAMIGPATTIAILAAIEALLSTVVADGMIGGKHRSNMELIAQGTANIFSPLFGGIPVTGAIARTATNIKNGGRTPVAGLIHALVLLLVMLFLGKLAGYIPLAVLASILIVVAYNMSEWRRFIRVLKAPKSDVSVLLTTFGLTIIFDLTIAIEIGMILAVFLFMHRMSSVASVQTVTLGSEDEDESPDPFSIATRKIPEGVEVFEVSGPFFFGAAEKFREELNQIRRVPNAVILRMRNVPVLDSTGLQVLEELAHSLRKKEVKLILSGVQDQPRRVMTEAGFADLLGRENLVENIDKALELVK